MTTIEHEPFSLNDITPDGHRGMLPNLHGPYGTEVVKSIGHYIDTLEALSKALTPPPQAMPYDKISMLPDPARDGILAPPGIQPDVIDKVCRDNMAPHMIIQMRLADVKRYSQLCAHPWRPGWRIEMRDGRRHPTELDLRDMRAAERFILNCNIESRYDEARQRDSQKFDDFGTFLAKAVRDMLRYDSVAIYTQCDALGRVVGFSALPASHIRLTGKNGYQGDPDIFAVLIDDVGSPQRGFTRKELTWYVFNPRTDVDVQGYGYSPIEMAVRLIVAFQNALELNMSTFDKNGIPNGILKLMGNGWSDKPLDALARMWLNMKRGISKYWALPAIGVPADGDIQVMNLNDLKDTDVRYKDHMNMVIGVFCTVMAFPVKRLGYHASGSHRDSAPPPDGSTSLVGDDDPGLAPLLINIEDVINPYLMWPRWPHLALRFTAKSPVEDMRQYEARANSMTYDEKRAENDLKSAENSLPPDADEDERKIARIMGRAPVDSNLAAVYQTVIAMVMASDTESGAADAPGGVTPGRRTGEKADPGKSLAHGKIGGVRRDSAAEKKNAKT